MGQLCDLFLDEHEPGKPCADPDHRKAIAAIASRDTGGPAWDPIVRGQDGGGHRDFLAGQPINCGSTLDLQGTETRDDDYGSYTVRLATGTLVRYETAWPKGWTPRQPKTIVLYVEVGGHTFTANADEWMRFRWPSRERS